MYRDVQVDHVCDVHRVYWSTAVQRPIVYSCTEARGVQLSRGQYCTAIHCSDWMVCGRVLPGMEV